MKRFTQIGFVALLILVPVGVLLAAKTKTGGAKKTAETKVTHRTSKQKAANEKLIKELLEIMEATDNKMTFAACAECLTQLKPPREVVVPAILRKADKMGWLKAEGGDDMAMLGDLIMEFLPHKHAAQPAGGSYAYMQAPFNLPQMPPPPTPPAYSTVGQTYSFGQQCPCQCPCPINTAPPMPSWPTGLNPAILAQPLPQPTCMPPNVGYQRTRIEMSTSPVPPSVCAPANYNFVYPCPIDCPMAQPVLFAPPPTDGKMSHELLRVLEETESKVTFVILVKAIYERGECWDAAVPAIIRKADKMGWLNPNAQDFADMKEIIAEIALTKPKHAEKNVSAPCPTPACPQAPSCVPATRIQDFGFPLDSIEYAIPYVQGSLPPPTERTPEVLPPPHSEKKPSE